MGIDAPLESVPAEAIGGLAVGVTPLEMADAYATLASGGIHHEPTAISQDRVPRRRGRRRPTPTPATGSSREGEAYEVTRLLEGVITQGTGAGYTSIGLRERGRQDRHLGGRVRRLVRRLHAALLDRGLGRPPAVARTDRLRRADRRARSGSPSCRRPRRATARISRCPPTRRPWTRCTPATPARPPRCPRPAPPRRALQPDAGSEDQGSEQDDEGGQGDTPQTASPAAPAPSPSPPPAVGGGLTPGGGVAPRSTPPRRSHPRSRARRA